MNVERRTKRRRKLPRWPYIIDLVCAGLLFAAGAFLASSDRSFVDLRGVGFALLLAGLLLGGLDAMVLRGNADALRVRTGLAFALVLGSVAGALSEKLDGTWLLFAVGLPNFIWFWIGLRHLTRERRPRG